jgi:putrescine transport system permease protein
VALRSSLRRRREDECSAPSRRPSPRAPSSRRGGTAGRRRSSPSWAALEKLDETLLEAAADLGATPFRAFWQVTFPLSLPGVVAGSLLCFIPAVGEFVIPDLLGGSETLMISKTLWTEFAVNRSWTVSSAVAVLLLALLVVPILFYQRQQARAFEGSR